MKGLFDKNIVNNSNIGGTVSLARHQASKDQYLQSYPFSSITKNL